MFGLVSGRRVQRRYSLSETTLQQGNFRGMVHKGTQGYTLPGSSTVVNQTCNGGVTYISHETTGI